MLEPLLFLLLMGDIDEEVESSKHSSFADDKNLSRSLNNADVDLLQEDLNEVYNWTKINNMIAILSS